MSAEGRERRYFVTQRKDGLFNVNCMLRSDVESLEVSLQICNYCKSMLSSMRIPVNQISLEQFFDRYDTYIPKSINRYETFSQVQDYSDDHAAVAERCKNETDYTCQQCGVKCKTNKALLHLHHINGVKSDNYPSNLRVLCVACHSERSFHKHLQTSFQSQISLVSKMRQEQGILDLR